MDIAHDRYYRPSGAIPLKGNLLMLLAGGAAAVILALAYSLFDYYVPIDVLRAVGAVGFGALVGGIVRGLALAGHVRHPAFCRLAGLVVGLIALYAAWVWFLWILSGYEFFILQPQELWLTIQFLAANGIWQAGDRVVPQGELYAWWTGEALLLVGLPVLMAANAKRPYCEQCGRWTEATDGVLHLRSDTGRDIRRELENENYSLLEELRISYGDAGDRDDAKVQCCPDCDESNYLTVTHVSIVEKKGEPQAKTANVVQNLLVPAEVAEIVNRPQPAARFVALDEHLESTQEQAADGSRAIEEERSELRDENSQRSADIR